MGAVRKGLDAVMVARAQRAKVFSDKRLAAAIDRARQGRPEENLSVPAIAVALGVSPQTVYNWLRERSHPMAAEPRISDASRLAAMLGCRPSDFLA